MKPKHTCTFSIFLFILFLSLPSATSASSAKTSASSAKMIDNFKFYNVGSQDTSSTTTQKLTANNFRCGPGKSTFLGIKYVQEKRVGQKTTEKINAIIDADKDLEEFGEGLKYEEMPIEVAICSPKGENPFSISTFLFSEYNQKILAIEIRIKNFELLKDKLTSKFGTCILDGYCENEDSVLILVQNGDRQLHVYFLENLKPHHEKIKKLKDVKKKKIKKSVEEAF